MLQKKNRDFFYNVLIPFFTVHLRLLMTGLGYCKAGYCSINCIYLKQKQKQKQNKTYTITNKTR